MGVGGGLKKATTPQGGAGCYMHPLAPNISQVSLNKTHGGKIMAQFKPCKRCGKPLDQVSNRPRMYCNDACRKAFTRYGSMPGLTGQVESGQSLNGQPKADTPEMTMHERQCAANNEGRSVQHTINTGPLKSFDKLDKGEHNRVSLPGDEDYAGAVVAVSEEDACKLVALGIL